MKKSFKKQKTLQENILLKKYLRSIKTRYMLNGEDIQIILTVGLTKIQ